MKIIFKNTLLLIALFATFCSALAQQNKKRIDGVVAIVGNHIILDSDIDIGFVEAKAVGYDVSNASRCEILGTLLENKLFMHQAVQDSIVVSKEEVGFEFDSQLDRMVENAGSLSNVLEFYKKKSVDEVRETLSGLIENNMLASRMQQKIVEKVQITPEEVRQYYLTIPKTELPMIGEEVELSEIVIKPVVTKEQKQAVIDKLNEIRKDVLDGDSFQSKVYMYTEDPGSISTGGFYVVDKKSQFAKQFKETAFSLKIGEISEPFETEFGYHIIILEDIKDNKLQVRHILMSPKPTAEAVEAAKEKIEKIRTDIVNQQITFEEAARKYSDAEESKNSGGIYLNPMTRDTRFEVNRIQDKYLYSMVSGLELKGISKPMFVNDMYLRQNFYRMVQVTKKIDEHIADYEHDYLKIKDNALNMKQSKVIAEWIAKKIQDTYIYLSPDYQDCKFKNNWAKK